MKPHLKTSFTYKGMVIRMNWYELAGRDLPDLPWQQVYVIGDIDGKVPVVHYATGDKDNLPGGKTEPDESVDETVRREMQEELNCDVVSWYPLGYQENHEPDGKVVYQLRVRAKLKPIGIFENDPGGAISGHTLVPLDELNEHIQYGVVGERLIALVAEAEGESLLYDGLAMVKPDPRRDAPFALSWLASPGGKETLLSMGNAEHKIKPPTLKEEEDRLRSFLKLEEAGKRLTWMMRTDNKTIGAAWIDLEDHGTVRAPSIHLMIGDISYRGKGIGKAVVHFMINYVRDVLKSEFIYSRNLVGNKRIMRINKSIGLKNDGKPYADQDGLVWQNTKMRL